VQKDGGSEGENSIEPIFTLLSLPSTPGLALSALSLRSDQRAGVCHKIIRFPVKNVVCSTCPRPASPASSTTQPGVISSLPTSSRRTPSCSPSSQVDTRSPCRGRFDDVSLPEHLFKETQMARTLDSQVSRASFHPPPVDHYHDRAPALPSHTPNPTPGFFIPGLSTSPAPPGSSWNVPQSSSPPLIHPDLPPAASHSHAAQQPLHQTEQSQPPFLPFPRPSSPSDPLSSAMASLSFSDTPQKKTPDSNGPPSLTAPLPTIASLIAGLPSVQANSASKVSWCRDVIGLVNRLYVAPNQTGSADPPSGPIHVADQELNNLVETAIPMVLQIANLNPAPQSLPLHISEAIYLRATFEATGSYPRFVPQNPRMAFRDYERAARAGFSAAWFKLGRDYENFGDFSHAKDCYERGIRNNNESCLYVSVRSFDFR